MGWAIKFYNEEEPSTFWSQTFKTKKQAESALWRFYCDTEKYDQKYGLPLQERWYKWVEQVKGRVKADIIIEFPKEEA